MSAATAVTTPKAGLLDSFTGTGHLIGFMLRRDRVRIAVWTLVIAILYLVSLAPGGEYAVLNDDPEARAARALTLSSPAMIAMGGPGYGLDDYTMGAAVANELILWMVVALAVMTILQVVRHTRSEEESGRSELMRAGVLGRHAPSLAVIVEVALTNLIVAVAGMLALVAMGLDPVDSAVMSFGIALAALVYGAVALVTSQLSESGGGAMGMAFAVVGATYVARVVGDIQEPLGSPLSWLSPIAWVHQTRVFVDTRIWPLGIAAVVALALLAVAAFLGSHRDFGAGMVKVRRGRADASPLLDGPIALAWVRQRTGLFWTAVGLGLMWFATGSILSEVPNMLKAVGDNPIYAELVKGGAEDMIKTFAAFIGGYSAFGAAAYAIIMTLRVKAEEDATRAALVLAKPLGRLRWLLSNTLVAALGSLVVLVTGIWAMGLGAAATGVDEIGFGDFTVLALAYVPAVLVIVALALALYAWAPQAASAVCWAVFGWMFLVLILADVLDLPDWVRGLSPFWWIKNTMIESQPLSHTLGLSAVALALLLMAMVGFRRRDIHG
ncbi:ABC transporter membrane-spanning protein [Nocardioidaceae bacterium Broad-1]|nr:ABC transporter membrane-spanning protein [Nocardioidaceae bacterium Broad-1]